MITYLYSANFKVVYLQTVNCNSGQRKEMVSISEPFQSSYRHLAVEAGHLRFVQKDKNSEVQGPPKSEFHRGREVETASELQQSSCFEAKEDQAHCRGIQNHARMIMNAE